MDERMIPQPLERAAVIDKEKLQKLTQTLQKYKTGKARLERRVVSAENWWKLRNGIEERKTTELNDGGFRSKSGWLHNVIVSKHADAMEAYPEPNILPREPGDEQEAHSLSSIVPVVMEQNHFEDIYSDAVWSKLKTGTGVYKVVWDAQKLNGLGDISIQEVDLLNLFWEPGIKDIQQSKYFFHTNLVDNDILESQYPQLKDKLKSNTFTATKFLYDDAVPTDGKSTVIDCYYKRWEQGKTVLHYVKYVNDEVLYSTENEGTTLYDHGLYPFVFDVLFPIEGSPCGYGFVDLCQNPQTAIDLMDTAFIRNTMVGAMPRYFKRQDAGVNEEEFLDLSKPLVTVDGNLGDDALKVIDFRSLPGNYIDYQRGRVNELRETSGNTETATGSTSQGVTAASAIAALQEASGKGSRDSTKTSYRAYSEIINLVIELIRQFYDIPRQFRIVGEMGAQEFITFSNAGIRPQPQGTLAGQDLGMRLPVFDVEVKAQKASSYTKMSQNELALQFYNLGFFNPQNTDQTLMCLGMMEFDGKDKLQQQVQNMGTMYQQMIMFQQLALSLAMKYEPEMGAQLAANITGQPMPQKIDGNAGMPTDPTQETTRVTNARAQARGASQPGGEV
ncbi:MAG: hypothetical protein Q3984_03635 [Eubacteriales bacterium]|nr:hypothetical protein [Eubacteriales bacterium]